MNKQCMGLALPQVDLLALVLSAKDMPRYHWVFVTA